MTIQMVPFCLETPVVDRVTGLEGYVTAFAITLTGTVMAKVDRANEHGYQSTFIEIERLQVNERVESKVEITPLRITFPDSILGVEVTDDTEQVGLILEIVFGIGTTYVALDLGTVIKTVEIQRVDIDPEDISIEPVPATKLVAGSVTTGEFVGHGPSSSLKNLPTYDEANPPEPLLPDPGRD